ncbi:hypothetical protein ISCGN_031609 [Ixodes scapularis]
MSSPSWVFRERADDFWCSLCFRHSLRISRLVKCCSCLRKRHVVLAAIAAHGALGLPERAYVRRCFMRLVAVYAVEVRGVTLRSCVGLRTAEASQLPLAASRNVTEEPASVALQRVVNHFQLSMKQNRRAAGGFKIPERG